MNEPSYRHGIKTREAILQAIIRYIEEHGYPPSYKEIGQMVGLRSKATIHNQIQRMFYEGMIETDSEQGTPRAIRVPGYEFRATDACKQKPSQGYDRKCKCGVKIIGRYTNYCGNCGQKLRLEDNA